MRVRRTWVGPSTAQARRPGSGPKRAYRAPNMAWNKLLLAVAAAVVVAAVLVVPGILNRGGQNPVAAAAEATSNVSGVRVTFTGRSQGPLEISLSGKGVMNGETNQASIEMSATGSTQAGVQGFTLDEVVDDGDVYMHSPELGSAFGGTEPWLLMRSEAFGDLLQSDASGAGFSGSPTQQLDALQDASYQVEQVGRERLGGVEATHYRAVIDIGKLTDQLKSQVSGDFGDLIERSMEQVSGATVDVWIDADGLLRRETSSSTMATLGTFTMTMDFSHYGIHPDIAVPPSSEVYDITPIMQKALDAVSS
jgi:hypothetical protein